MSSVVDTAMTSFACKGDEKRKISKKDLTIEFVKSKKNKNIRAMEYLKYEIAVLLNRNADFYKVFKRVHSRIWNSTNDIEE